MSDTQKLENRAIIKFCCNLGMTPTKTFEKIQQANKENKISRSLVFKWHKRFSDGRENVKDDKRCGRNTIINARMIDDVKTCLNKDTRQTIEEIMEATDCSYGTLWRILHDHLRMSRVSARWVPRILTDEERNRRVRESTAFLRRHRREPDFLDRIITCDETWLWTFDPESKQQSSVWKTTNSPPPKKARVNRCGEKSMVIMFADKSGIILCHAVKRGCTVNSAYYSKVLRRDLVHALEKKRPGRPISTFLLHHDNAPAHTAADTRLELSLMDLECVPHPAYSPDLAPMDFAVFPEVKGQLRGRRFESIADLLNASQRILCQLDEAWFSAMYQRWIHRHERCVQAGGHYFEKQ